MPISQTFSTNLVRNRNKPYEKKPGTTISHARLYSPAIKPCKTDPNNGKLDFNKSVSSDATCTKTREKISEEIETMRSINNLQDVPSSSELEAIMGLTSFESTSCQKHKDIGFANRRSKSKYRQFMNRHGGNSANANANAKSKPLN